MTPKKWIQKSKFEKGTLTDYCKKNRNDLKKKYKEDPFNNDGTLRVSVLKKLAADKDVHEKTRKRARLALTLKKTRR